MFEKYNIDELFLAEISVEYPDPMCESDWEINVGGMLFSSMTGYCYWSIVRKNGKQYFDLKSKKNVTESRNPRETSYTIEYMEPLSNYYTQDGKKRESFSGHQALKEAEKHYDEIHHKQLALIKNKNN